MIYVPPARYRPRRQHAPPERVLRRPAAVGALGLGIGSQKHRYQSGYRTKSA
ncbi:hypothetical protein [Hymenobacter convexus]|uniref:hypothetical protein n=1 Tax=Hymenobacter sp. CA1UV-4 TaxID=3063782 RepID=UPI002712C700|nr:hypothetical protein [Hymenobacter sp. CA1UV-4]MDO7854370.1 hypothetical protein [Hymenobacter sp. CA1UV-4]